VTVDKDMLLEEETFGKSAWPILAVGVAMS
jgi:hypothetical protein